VADIAFFLFLRSVAAHMANCAMGAPPKLLRRHFGIALPGENSFDDRAGNIRQPEVATAVTIG